jgi:hypothetical protein
MALGPIAARRARANTPIVARNARGPDGSQIAVRRRSPSRASRLWMMACICWLAGCGPGGQGGSSTVRVVAEQRSGPGAPALLPPPVTSQPGRRMWTSDFRDAVEGMDGEWQVRVPRHSRCRLVFEPPGPASRTGRVRRHGGCFGDTLFSVHAWTMTGAGEMVLVDMMRRPLATLHGVTPGLFRGTDLTLERVRLPE